MTRNPTLPAGWTSEPAHGDRYTVIQHPDRGWVTIDWRDRGFRTGQFFTGRMTSVKRYTGRAWRGALFTDAVAWLEDLGDALPAPDLEVRISGVSLALSAAGTIGLTGATGTPLGITLPATFMATPPATASDARECPHQDSTGASWVVAMDVTHERLQRAARVCTQCQAYRLVLLPKPGVTGLVLSDWYQGDQR